MILLYLLLGGTGRHLSAAAHLSGTRLYPQKKRTANASGTPRKSRRHAHCHGKLSKMVQVNTVVLPGEDNPHQFDPMIETLSQLFPNVFQKFHRMDYLDNNLLLKWESGNSNKEGILFMGHMDVVDAAGEWKHDPFGGEIIDDVLWGRGSIDIKSGLCGFFEAFEQLIAEGMTPNRDLYIFCSRTEENSGPGAQMAVDYLHDHGIHLEMVLDEGCSIGENPMEGVHRPTH